MDLELIKWIIVGVLVFLIAIYIFKTTVKLAIIVIIIVYLFRVGWVYTSDDIRGTEFLEKFLKKEAVESIYDKYDRFTQKRDENPYIDAEGLEDAIKQEILDKTNEFINKHKDGKDGEENP